LILPFLLCGDSISARVPGAPEGSPHGRAVQVFAQVHQRQKRAQDSRFQVIREVQTARRHPGQPLPMLRDKPHDLTLPVLWRIAQRGLSSHLAAAGFQSQREMKHAEPLFFQCRWCVVFASRDLAGCSHELLALHDK